MGSKNITFKELIEDAYPDSVLDEILYKDDKEIQSISTGSLSLDISTGIGGIPRGRVTEIYGPESASKTTLCLQIAGNCNGKVLYIDQENSLDKKYISQISGITDFSNFILLQPETGEQALQMFEYGLASKEFDLIILDSIGTLAPEEEKRKELTENSMALVSRLLSKFFRRNSFAIRVSNTACVFVNQVRDNIGSFIGGFSRPGGNALKHYDSLVIQLVPSTKIKDGDNVIGSYINFVVKKNKLASPFKSSKYPLIYGKGVDKLADTITFAEVCGALSKRGSYYVYDGEVIGHGLSKTSKYLEEHPDVLDKITKLCYNSSIMHSGFKYDERYSGESLEEVFDGEVDSGEATL